MNVIFMGTPQISCDVLKKLLSLENVNLLCVVSQPDRNFDRKKNVIYSPVKIFCLENNIKLFQPIKLNDIYNDLASLDIDLIITCAFGQFIPESVLKLPKIGCFNLHASLLPLLRGGAPINWAIINGFDKTGITLMRTIKKMDAGSIIDQLSCSIDKDETTKSLTEKISKLACEILEKNWALFSSNDLIKKVEIQQNENEATFGLNITKEQEIINFNMNAKQVDQLVRGLYDKPIAKWKYKDILIKVYELNISDQKSFNLPGEITKIDKTGIYISTLDFDVCLKLIQLPNKKIMNVNEILNGNNIFLSK